MEKIAERRAKMAEQLRKQHRREMFAEVRAGLVQEAMYQEWPIVSSVLSDFMDCNNRELCLHSEALRSKIEQCCCEELTDREQQDLVTDMAYLLEEDIIEAFEVRFKRNQSPLVAYMVATLSLHTSQEDLEYWIDFMPVDIKALVFLNIPEDEGSHLKWFDSKKLFGNLLSALSQTKQAAYAFEGCIIDSECFSKKHADISVNPLNKALWAVQDLSHRGILLRIWMQLSLMIANTPGEQLRGRGMLDVVRTVLLDNVLLLGEADTVQGLNEVYRQVCADYLGGQQIIFKVLEYWISQMKGWRKGESGQCEREYVMLLCLNNWRAKQLSQPGFKYSPLFFKLLNELHNPHSQNPYYHKLSALSQQ